MSEPLTVIFGGATPCDSEVLSPNRFYRTKCEIAGQKRGSGRSLNDLGIYSAIVSDGICSVRRGSNSSPKQSNQFPGDPFRTIFPPFITSLTFRSAATSLNGSPS